MARLPSLFLVLLLSAAFPLPAGSEDASAAQPAQVDGAPVEADAAGDPESGVTTRGAPKPKLPPPPPPLKASPPPAQPAPADRPLPPDPNALLPKPRPLPKVPGSGDEAPTADDAPRPPRTIPRPPPPSAADPAPSSAPDLAAPPARPTRRPAAATDEPLPEDSDTKPVSVGAKPAATGDIPDSPQIGSPNPQGDFQRGQIRRENARRNLLESGGSSSSETGDAQPSSAPTIGRQRSGNRLEVETGSIEEAVIVPPRVPRPAPADAETPPPSPRPARNFKKKPIGDDVVPQQGDVVAVGKSGRKNLLVVKRLGGGSWGEVFIVEDKAGEMFVLKQQKAWPKVAPPGMADPYGEYRTRLEQYRKATGRKANLLEPDGLVKEAAKHEVEMQNFAATALSTRGANADLVDPAELVGRGRIKQKFAGASFDNLLEDINGLADDNPAKEAGVRMLLRDMLGAAAALDSIGVVHRDLHTGNVALDANGRVKILDFGLAKRATDPDVQLEMSTGVGAGGTYGAATPPETRSAMNAFLNRKATPDQIEASLAFASTPKADVYSIGQILAKKVDPNTALTPMLKAPPKGLIDLLNELRADDPNARPSAADALRRLDALATPADAGARTQLQTFAARRSAAALAEPPGAADTVAGAAKQ